MNNGEGLPGVHYYPVIAKAAESPRPRTAKLNPLAVYVHIPFCDKRCYFCEFAVVAEKSVTDLVVNEYLQALRHEMRRFLATAEHRPAIELIQFGGGTPTSLSAPLPNTSEVMPPPAPLSVAMPGGGGTVIGVSPGPLFPIGSSGRSAPGTLTSSMRSML